MFWSSLLMSPISTPISVNLWLADLSMQDVISAQCVALHCGWIALYRRRPTACSAQGLSVARWWSFILQLFWLAREGSGWLGLLGKTDPWLAYSRSFIQILYKVNWGSTISYLARVAHESRQCTQSQPLCLWLAYEIETIHVPNTKYLLTSILMFSHPYSM